MPYNYLNDPNRGEGPGEPDGQIDMEREFRDALSGLEAELAAVRGELSETHFQRETAFAEVKRLQVEIAELRARANANEIIEYADLLARRDGNDQCSIYELAQWVETGKGAEWLAEDVL